MQNIKVKILDFFNLYIYIKIVNFTLCRMGKYSVDLFFGNDSPYGRAMLYIALNQELFSLKDLQINKRVIGHWDTENILRFNKGDSTKHRRYSFIDLVWLRMVTELREMGVGLEVIRKAKEYLFKETPNKEIFRKLKDNPEKLEAIQDEYARNELTTFLNSEEFEKMDPQSGYSTFFLLLFETINNKTLISIKIFLDGFVLPVYGNDYSNYTTDALERIIYDTHITVSISKIIKEFLANSESAYVLPKLKILGINELKLLEIINSGEYEAVTINFKNKKMKSLLLVKEQDVKKKLVDILTENAYQDIVIKSHAGIVTRIQNIQKVFFQ